MKFMQIEPQPARGVLRESMWTDPNWIAEEKYDGDRRIAQFCGNMARFTGRRISVKDGLFVEKTENVPHLSGSCVVSTEHARRTPRSLEGTVLDGEMIATGEHIEHDCATRYEPNVGGMSKYVTSIMGSLPEEAVRKQIERGWLRYVVFDCLFYKGEDIRDQDLYRRWSCALRAVKAWGNPFVSISEQYGDGSDEATKRGAYNEIVKRGGEGVILKRLDHRYGDKTGWVKVKRQATADVVIMGTVEAKATSKKKGDEAATSTKFHAKGWIGAISCGQYEVPVDEKGEGTRCNLKPGSNNRVGLVEVATVSGMDDTLRAKISSAPKKYIGMVIEIEHNGREPTGRFRHPRFNRFRDDKRAIDCVMREDES